LAVLQAEAAPERRATASRWARAGTLAAHGLPSGRGLVRWRTADRAGWHGRAGSAILGLFEES
jgi:hypothetical protein